MALKLNIGLLALSLSLSLVHLDGARAGMATRYWDCCKPSASWGNKAPVYSPVDVCKADGVTLIDPTTADSGQSGCNGGDQYMCSCMQPFDDETDSTLALGFAAFSAGSEEATDCGCYIAEFSGDESGKAMKKNKLLFQVTNTGGDVQSENLDFQIPGGGLGAFTQGCPKQWKDNASDWGETYGGVKSSSQCTNLPEPLQEGCKWRFTNWGDNPKLVGKPKRVKCPKSLIDRSGCQRKDDNTVSPYSGKIDAANGPAPAQYKRDRSVCLAGGKKKGSSASSGASSDESAGSDDGAGAAPGAGSGDNAGVGAGQDQEGQPESSGNAPGSNVDNGDASQEGYVAPIGGSAGAPKKHKVCRRSH